MWNSDFEEFNPNVNESTSSTTTKTKSSKKKSKKEKIIEFCKKICASLDFCDSCKQIYTCNADGETKRLCWYRQVYDGYIAEQVGKFTILNNVNYYITKNSFVANKHCNEGLFSFDNIVLDIDAHATNDFELIDYEVDKLIYFLETDFESEFPHFSAIHTGRGVQIWIHLVSFSAKLRLIYDWICEYFCSRMIKILNNIGSKLKLDTAATKNAVQFVRLPNTPNTHRPGFCSKIIRKTDERYTFQDLLEEFPIESAAAAEQAKCKKIENLRKIDENYTGLNRKRVNFIETIIQNADGNCTGRRDKLLFLYYNAAVQIWSQDDAQQKTKQLDKKFGESLKDTEISSIFNYIDKHGYLKFRNKTFLDWCEASDAERAKYTDTSIRDAEREQARKKRSEKNEKIEKLINQGKSDSDIAAATGCSTRTAARRSAAAKRRAKDERNEQICRLYLQGLSFGKIAKALGIGIATVSRVLHEIQP